MTEQTKREVIDRYIDAYNRCDIDGMVAQLHRDIAFLRIVDSVVTAEADGIDQFRELALQSIALFSSRQQTVTDFKAAADQAEVEICLTGVLAVDLPSGLRKGEALSLEGRTDFEFAEDKIVKIADIS